MKKSTVILASLLGLFVGIVIGFLISPVKNGLEIGNNNGNTRIYYDKQEENDSDEEATEE